MDFIPLASSSKGNAYLVGDGSTRLLLECGIPYKKLLRLSGYALKDVSACFVTHEHKDHCKCVDKLMERGIPVYMSEGTAKALNPPKGFHTLKRLCPESTNYDSVQIGTMEVLPFMTLHDGSEPVGFYIENKERERLLFATDTVALGYNFFRVNIVAIECNHGDNIRDGLEAIPYRQRAHIIRTSNTHMSVGRCCEFLSKLDKSHLREVYLLHMSDSHGDAEQFQQKVQTVVGNDVRVTVCPKESSPLPPRV